MKLRTVSVREMKAIDERAIREYGIPSLQLMENAGRAVSRRAGEIYPTSGDGKQKILVICGKGNNGGDGLVAARFLSEEGKSVTVILLAAPDRMSPDARQNLGRLEPSAVSLLEFTDDMPFNLLQSEIEKCGLMIDAMFGVGLTRPLDLFFQDVIKTVNASGKKVLAVDIPSGLEGDSGEPLPVAIKATETVTLALPKTGLFQGRGPEFAGKVTVADIGIPGEIAGLTP